MSFVVAGAASGTRYTIAIRCSSLDEFSNVCSLDRRTGGCRGRCFLLRERRELLFGSPVYERMGFESAFCLAVSCCLSCGGCGGGSYLPEEIVTETD